MSFHFNANTSTVRNLKKLTHLARMHVVVEFLLLTQARCNFSEESCQSVAEQACNNYMGRNSPIQSFSMLQNNKLCDLTITLNSADSSITQK